MDLEDVFGFLGVAAVLLLGVVLVRVVLSIPDNPATVTTLAASWPWAAKHLQGLTWTAAAIVFGVTLVIPPKLMSQSAERGDAPEHAPLNRLGMLVFSILVSILVGLAIRAFVIYALTHWLHWT